MIKKIDFYLSKIFTYRFLSVLSLFLISAFFIEILDVKKHLPHSGIGEQSALAMLKLPLLTNKILPFLVFISIILFFFRLFRYQELISCFSAGISLKRLIAAPLWITAIIAIFDLFIITDLTPVFLKQYPKELQPKSLQLQSGENEWFLAQNKKYRILIRMVPHSKTTEHTDQKFEIYYFNSYFSFLKKYVAQEYTLKNQSIELKKVWFLQKGLSPTFKEQIEIPNPFVTLSYRKMDTLHPSIMSFSQSWKALFSGFFPDKGSAHLRLQYLISNAFWLISLIFLGASTMAGAFRLRKRILWLIIGLIICLILFLGRELLYMLSFTHAHLISSLFFWLIPLITAWTGALVLFEKKEF